MQAAAVGLPRPGTGRRRHGAANTLRLGEKLHVGVVVAELSAEPSGQLSPGLNHSYNLGLAPFDAGAKGGARLDAAALTPAADLRSEGLLRDEPINGRPNKALGYVEGELPGFALPPPTLTDLRILHGSCRRPRTSTRTTTRARRASTASPGSTT